MNELKISVKNTKTGSIVSVLHCLEEDVSYDKYIKHFINVLNSIDYYILPENVLIFNEITKETKSIADLVYYV